MSSVVLFEIANFIVELLQLNSKVFYLRLGLSYHITRFSYVTIPAVQQLLNVDCFVICDLYLRIRMGNSS